MSEETLNRCPFCGGEAEEYGSTLEGYGIQCKKCGCATPQYNDGLYQDSRQRNQPRAIETWNKRVSQGEMLDNKELHTRLCDASVELKPYPDFYLTPDEAYAIAAPFLKREAQAGEISDVVPDEGPFPPSMLDQFAGCRVDDLDTNISYNLTGTHLKQFFQSYRMLYRHWEIKRESVALKALKEIASYMDVSNAWAQGKAIAAINSIEDAAPARESSAALRLREAFVKRINSIPLGEENYQWGASYYNWGRAHIAVLDELLAEMNQIEGCQS